MTLNKKTSSAFTLIELLVVIAIIGILAGILIPAIGKVRLSAQSAGSVSNMRQLGAAIFSYVNENGGRYPSARWNGEDAWHKAIYERIYETPWRENVSQPLLPNSVFWSPVVSPDLYRELDPSTGWKRRFCYGMNNYFKDFGSAPNAPNLEVIDGVLAAKIMNPAQTCLLGDTPGGMNFAPAQKAFPNAGNTMNALFFDGHVESLTVDEVPERWEGPAESGGKTGEMFWMGGPVPGRIEEIPN